MKGTGDGLQVTVVLLRKMTGRGDGTGNWKMYLGDWRETNGHSYV